MHRCMAWRTTDATDRCCVFLLAGRIPQLQASKTDVFFSALQLKRESSRLRIPITYSTQLQVSSYDTQYYSYVEYTSISTTQKQ